MKRSGDDIHRRVVEILCERYSPPLVDNSDRGIYIETMIAEILGSDWELTWRMAGHSSWSMWDIEHQTSRKKIEVKQSAACQTWSPGKSTRVNPRFDIKQVDGYWGGDCGAESEWIPLGNYQRLADLYIFAWHGVTVRSDANHCDITQWEFYVVPEERLPKGQKTIGLGAIKEIVNSTDHQSLAGVVTETLSGQSIRDT